MKEDSDNILNDEFYDDNNDLLDENDADSVEKLDDPEPFYNQMNGEFELLFETHMQSVGVLVKVHFFVHLKSRRTREERSSQ